MDCPVCNIVMEAATVKRDGAEIGRYLCQHRGFVVVVRS